MNHKTGEVGALDGTMINYNTGTSTGSMVMHDTQVGDCLRIFLQIFLFSENIFLKTYSSLVRARR